MALAATHREGRAVRIGSLFAGIGGFDLAARWMGWETAWFSEIDPYASAVLAKHWPQVPNHGDITQIDFTQVEPVDMLCGGFPCQPHSLAGKRKASADERDLWGEYERAIRLLRPRYVVAENVPGLLTSERGEYFARVLGSLAALRYDAEWTVLSAADVGAPHLRERVWIVAYPTDHGTRRRIELAQGGEGAGHVAHTDRRRCEQRDARERSVSVTHQGGAVGNADVQRLAELEAPAESDGPELASWAAHARGRQWLVEPAVGRVAHGVSRRVDRIKCLGNAIVPQCALEIFRAIEAAEAARRVA
jgi:DNA (cytosine-5)-methyltransferase 1